MNESVPEDRCGKEMEINVRNTLKVDRYCCFRPVWKDTGKCIWHADVEGKPPKELKKRKLQRGERLDETILRGVSCPDLDFSDSTLIKSKIEDSTISGKFEGCILHDIEVISSDLSSSYFEGADLTGGKFRSSIFIDCDFSKTHLSIVKFLDSSFVGSTFIDSLIESSKFKQSDFRGTDFDNSTISGVDFSNLNLLEASFNYTTLVDLSFDNSIIAGGDFKDSKLSSVSFQCASLSDVNFTNANARGTTFDGSNLEDATFIQAELRDANLRNTRLYQTLFADTRINSNTDFGYKTAYEDPDTNLGESYENTRVNSNPDFDYEITYMNLHTDHSEDYEDTSRFEAAAWVYRRLQDLHEENAMSEKAREYHVRKEEAKRQKYRESDEWFDTFQWLIYSLNWGLTKHGESLLRVVVASVLTIFLSAVIYPLTGGISTGGEVFRYSAEAALGGLFLRSLYFSTVTFTTLGYGDYHPVGPAGKALAGVESLAGALLVALFVFVLGRRVAR